MQIKSVTLLSVLGWVSAQATPRPNNAPAPSPQSEDNAEHCKPYSAPIVQEIVSNFPPIWEPASIVEGDTTARNKFDEIKQVLPSYIKPKGTHDGDFSSVTYDPSDPDCWFTRTKCTNPKIEGLSEDLATLPEPRTWGLGFDDGPNCSHQAFMSYMKDNDLTASLFYIGSNVLNWPYEAQEGREDGHELCAHTWSHHYMTSFDDEGAFAELYYSIQAIKQVTGVTPTCWRPPFGDIDDRIRIIAEGLGLRTALWEYDTNDWKMETGTPAADVRQNYENVFDAAKKGSFNDHGTIVLTHEITGDTMNMFMEMYPKIKDNFDYVVPFYAATNTTNLYVEDDAEGGEVFADYVRDVYGSYVDQATTTITNNHPEPTLTGWQGPLATVANPTVTAVEAAKPTNDSGGSEGSESGGDYESGVDDSVDGDNNWNSNTKGDKSNPKTKVYNYHNNKHTNNGDSSDDDSGAFNSVTASFFTILAVSFVSATYTF